MIYLSTLVKEELDQIKITKMCCDLKRSAVVIVAPDVCTMVEEHTDHGLVAFVDSNY